MRIILNPVLFYVIVFALVLSVGNTEPAMGQQKRLDLQFEILALPQGGASNEVRQVYQDCEGFIWIATNSGLIRYDGYDFITYKSNLYNRNLLSNNAIQRVIEDRQHNLWIGTSNGLNILHKKTGEIVKVPANKLGNNFIQVFLVTREGQVWIGTNGGLYIYQPEKDSFYLVTAENSDGQFNGWDIKTLIEDAEGQIWIGTWSQGFYRYDPKKKCYYAYPPVNPMNSAHVMYADSQNNIWIGTWGYGLFRLVNPYDPEHFSYVQYRHIPGRSTSILDDIVYAIAEDRNTRTLWVGSRSGLSLLPDISRTDFFYNYSSRDGENSISYSEVNSILQDQDNNMWLGLFGGGINRVDTRRRQFNLHRLEEVKRRLSTNSVRSLLQDDEGFVWLGIGSFGLVRHDLNTDKCIHYTDLPEFRSVPVMPTVNAMMQRRNGEIWFATYNGGIYIYDKKAPVGKQVRVILPEEDSWLLNRCVYQLLEDSAGNIWIGSRDGINVLTPAGEKYSFAELKTADAMYNHLAVMDILEDEKGNMWFATDQQGIFRMNGDFHDPQKVTFTNYSRRNAKIQANNVSCLYLDHKHRIWGGTEGEGLVLYDPQKDGFTTMQKDLRLPGDVVHCMEEDEEGKLWLGTDVGLLRLQVGDHIDSSYYRLYTTIDGLQDNAFNRNAVFKSAGGELFFGGHKGYNSFRPEELQENRNIPPVVITDVKIANRSWHQLDSVTRYQISALAPEFSKKVVLTYRDNNFNIDFAVLSYADPAQHKYAYRLEGFDTKWNYTDAARPFAYYNNLKSGTYRFQLKGSNEHGVWNKLNHPLEIVVKPAPWATWWAYGLYALIILAVVWYILKVMHKRFEIEAAMKLTEMKRQKSEEMNHAKLQFFTNITHELMTPLTIISASLDELKLVLPAHSDYYEVLSVNTRRLMRLLQQILEFRKAESGNLKLKVSPGNLSRFVKNSVDSFRPLIKKKGLTVSLMMEQEEVKGYFDQDKLDKILYNLLSNAAKYNKENSVVEVRVTSDPEQATATISVKDNGEGISAEAMKTLFKRFYEGNYRRFNTVGTGIGLSLTKDLVELHKGSIRVESEKGKGAMFMVTIPLQREVYEPEQIDDENEVPGGWEEVTEESVRAEEPVVQIGEEENAAAVRLLVVEDNEELLQLMQRLLSREYRVFTARNGKEGIAIAEKEEIDLIVSDVMIPEIDGNELCRYIKNKFELCHIPVLLLTAKQSEEDKIAGYESGADGYLTKPFSLSLLHARIKSLLKNRERTARDFKKQMVLETQELHYTSMDEEFVQKAVDCIYRHLDDCEFDVERFVEEMGTSKSTLYSKLKSLTGLHTTAFIRNIRLKAACRLIEEKKKIRISELAYAVGFNDAKYFSSCFKKEFGMLPTDYMEKYNS